MPQQELIPQGWEEELDQDQNVNIRLKSKEYNGTAFSFTFEPIRTNLFRTTFTSKIHPLPPHPAASIPKVQLESDLSVHRQQSSKRIVLGNVVASLEWTRTPIVSLALLDRDSRANGQESSSPSSKSTLHADLPFRSYAADGAGIAHYTTFNTEGLHVGLGEKAAPMDLSRRSFRITATDSFGYDCYLTDPLYKHIPLLIFASPTGCVAQFSTSHSRAFVSVGSEMDGMWGKYKVYRQDYGGLEEYLIIGRTLSEVVRTYADLVGYPRLVPRWAFGYIAGGMRYSMMDEPRAAEVLRDFTKRLKNEDIPCSGFQLSSGYTVAETEPKTRNVFTWNKHRFPDLEKFIQDFRNSGIRLIANVKPYVLSTHPEYQELAEKNAFFNDPGTHTTAVTRLWSAGGGESGEGSHIDFTSAAGFKWWYDGVQALRKIGIEVPWNDNNEYTIPSDDWECKLDEPSLKGHSDDAYGSRKVGLWGRALHTELNGKASHDALVDLNPHTRPFILTRSATAGTMRYAASSWSGDNVTSWKSMRGSTALSLTAGMCLLQCYGHDIGGFEGPQPSAELFLRWTQLGIYSPRFAINCFKTSPTDNNLGDVIEPWMYPEITHLIRKTLKRRYELIPYLYSLSLESHLFAKPSQRWVGWGYEQDPEVWSPELRNGEAQYWLGDALLVGGVFEPGLSKARIYLPKTKISDGDGLGFINLNTPNQRLEAGQWVEIDSPWQSHIPLLAKEGTAIPVGIDKQTLSPGETENPASLPADDYRAVEIFPPLGDHNAREFSSTWYEDDGISRQPDIAKLKLSYFCGSSNIMVKFSKTLEGKFTPLWKELEVISPVGEKRQLVDWNGACLEDLGADQLGRARYKLSCEKYSHQNGHLPGT